MRQLSIETVIAASDDGVANFGRHPFADDDGCNDDQQDEGYLSPGDRRDRGVERQTDAARSNEAKHR